MIDDGTGIGLWMFVVCFIMVILIARGDVKEEAYLPVEEQVFTMYHGEPPEPEGVDSSMNR